jgi:protein involved in sex pheromone biosynthesis
MKFIFSKAFLFLSVITLSSVFIATGCRKKKDTIANIYVKDAANQPVEGCKVILKGVSTTNNPANVVLYDTAYSDADGIASFNFNEEYKLGQAGVAVLNIDAKKNGLKGTGIIKIEEEVTNEETVFIQ